MQRAVAQKLATQRRAPAMHRDKKGKPPGGDPAAPVRRRSCRGAGSATAGARLLMWELQALSARVFHIRWASVGAARTPVMAHTVAVTSTAITSTEPIPIGSAQAVENRKAPLLILVQALVQRICGVGQFLQGRPGVRQGCGALTQT